MTKTQFIKLLSSAFSIVLIAAMALFTVGCNDNTANTDISSASNDIVSKTEATVLGSGATQISVTVTDKSGNVTAFTVCTEKTTVGDALSEVGLISGSEGPYGLTVETVNGKTVTWDADGKYWAFYIDGEYAMTGVDSTEITDGAEYAFKVE